MARRGTKAAEYALLWKQAGQAVHSQTFRASVSHTFRASVSQTFRASVSTQDWVLAWSRLSVLLVWSGLGVLFCMVQTQCSTLDGPDSVFCTQCSTPYGPDSVFCTQSSILYGPNSILYSVWSGFNILLCMVWTQCCTLYGPN